MIRLTNEQWERIRDHFPEQNIANGRKPTPTRYVLEAALWIHHEVRLVQLLRVAFE